jgi:hypothetical protein
MQAYGDRDERVLRDASVAGPPTRGELDAIMERYATEISSEYA